MSRRKPVNPMIVQRLGVEETLLEDLYHRMLRLSWPKLFGVVLVVYLCVNALFAALYLLNPGSVANIAPGDFASAFAFSVQTFSTVGYGHFYPQTNAAHVLVALETGFGLFATALLTGLVFSKFARPSARVVFSNHMLHTTTNGDPMLIFRMGNVRANQIFEGQARLTLLRDEVTSEGEKLRRLVELKVLRDRTPLFNLSWTIFHPIDDSSPFKGLSLAEIHATGWELFVTFVGLDQDMGQSIAANCTYTVGQIIHARKFKDMIKIEGRTRIIDYSKLHDIEDPH